MLLLCWFHITQAWRNALNQKLRVIPCGNDHQKTHCSLVEFLLELLKNVYHFEDTIELYNKQLFHFQELAKKSDPISQKKSQGGLAFLSYFHTYIKMKDFWRCESKWRFRSDKQPQPTQQRTMKRWVVVCLHGTRGEIAYGEGMLLHQRDDADADRGHSWWLGVMDDEGNWRLEPSYSLGSARTNTELNRLKIALLHLEVGAANGQRCSWHPEAMG